VQLADGDSCFGVTTNYLIISQDDHYNSMRIGLSSEFMLTDRLKFVADAAYVPLVNMSGVDYHNARGAYFPETTSDGYGTMMEGVFSYNVTDHWDVGAGGRYWAWTMRHGTSESIFETLGQVRHRRSQTTTAPAAMAPSSSRAITGAIRHAAMPMRRWLRADR
jgi:hypothetical protein